MTPAASVRAATAARIAALPDSPTVKAVTTYQDKWQEPASAYDPADPWACLGEGW